LIDDLLRVDALLTGMREALPLLAAPTPELAAVIRKQKAGYDLPRQWRVIDVTYAGDPGGIMCRLDDGKEGGVGGFVVSITHLTFDRKVPMAREIAAYQKHRAKWLRKLGAHKRPLQEDRGV
jgi:hypothetical protein